MLETYSHVADIPGFDSLPPDVAQGVQSFFAFKVGADRLAAYESRANGDEAVGDEQGDGGEASTSTQPTPPGVHPVAEPEVPEVEAKEVGELTSKPPTHRLVPSY